MLSTSAKHSTQKMEGLYPGTRETHHRMPGYYTSDVSDSQQLNIPEELPESLTQDRLDENLLIEDDSSDPLREFSERFKNSFPRNANYDLVTALLVYWEDDDLGCEAEVHKLRDLLKETFNYVTKILKLPRRFPDMVLQAEINIVVVNSDKEKKRNLIMVYYGGHGKPDDTRKGSVWSAYSSPSSPWLKWDTIQPQLERASGDVVLIIDSCYAAQAARGGPTTHKIELLAASAMNVTTPRAGDGSFTAALMAQMKLLLKTRGWFTISQLQGELIRRPAGLQETPVYCDLTRNTQPSITLHPIPRPGDSPKALSFKPCATLTLQISLLRALDKEHVQHLADWLTYSPPNTVSDISVEKIMNSGLVDVRLGISTNNSASLPALVSTATSQGSRSSDDVRPVDDESSDGEYVGTDEMKPIRETPPDWVTVAAPYLVEEVI